MPRHLFERLTEIRGQLRRILLLYGTCWLVVGVLGGATFATLLDWALHVSGGLRLLLLSAIAVLAVWLSVRYLIRPLGVRVRDLDLALRIERLYPELGERLSSSVDFLKLSDSDPCAGSRQLRETVVREALEACRPLEFRRVLEPQPARRLAAGALATVVVAGVLSLASPSDAAIALRRLFNPFSGPEWPQRTHFALVEPKTKVAKGDPFAVEVAVSGVVPRRVDIAYRFAAGEQSAPEPLRPTADGRYRGGLDVVTRSFEFRISGGDAQTEWFSVEVVPAPEVAGLQLQLEYPKYTRLPAETYPEGRGHVRAVVGTKVTVHARANKPLARAELAWDQSGATAAEVREDGYEVVASFTVKQDDEYRMLLTDREGMASADRSPTRYRVQAMADVKPEVALQRPPGDQEVTAQATVPLRALVTDDFGIAKAELRYEVQGSGPAAPKAVETAVPLYALGEPGELLRRHAIEFAWPLEPLKLNHGTVVVLHVAAADFCDAPGPNVGKSRQIRLKIVGKHEFLAQIEGEQQLLREELQRVLKLQESAHSQTSDLQKRAALVGRLKPDELDALQSAEMIQRRVREKIADSEQSLKERVEQLLQSLLNNRVDDVETSKRLVMMQSELGRLNEQHLPPILHSLTEARKAAQGAPQGRSGVPSAGPTRSGEEKKVEAEPKGSAEKARPGPAKPEPAADRPDQARPDSAPKKAEVAEAPPPPASPAAEERNGPARPLETAKEHQEKVIAALVQMLEQLDKWETVAQLATEARELERNQAAAAAQRSKIGDQTLGKSEAELTAEEKAALAQAAARQNENREQLQRMQRKMSRMAEKLEKDEPATSDLLNEALRKEQERNIGGQMADAANDIRQNKLGDAARRQGQIADALRELAETLENRREQELARLVKQLREAEKDLQNLKEEQQKLLQKTQEARNSKDQKEVEEELKRLKRRQQELERKTEEFARRLSRLQAQQVSQRTGRAAGRMDQAQKQMQQGRADDAEAEQNQALEELERAQEELAEARQKAEDELAREQIAKVADTIRQLHQRQLAVREEIERLENLRAQSGAWSRGQVQSLLSLARSQLGLAEESKGLTEKISAAKVFVMVVEQAIELMEEVSGRLKERNASPATQQTAADAAERFAQLLEALRPDPNQQAQPKKQQQQGAGAGGGGGGGGGDGIPNIAQIKLLKLLQAEIHRKTVALAEVRQRQEPWSAEQEKQFENLSQRQGRLADMVRDLTRPTAPGPEKEGGLQ